MRLFSKKTRMHLSKVCVFIIANQIILPSAVALTSGPSQPEFSDFEPVGTTEMVDLFSGDFTYNIPLFELPGPHGGYPFNLAYHAGIGVEDEASWVGLGWSLNAGAITRQMRGLPDEFNGDQIETITSMKPDVTVGVNSGINAEIFGGDLSKSTIGLNTYFNSYRGFGYSIDGNLAFGKAIEGNRTGPQFDLGFTLDPNEGIGLEPSFGLAGNSGEFGLSTGYHSKSGLHSARGYASFRKETQIQKKSSNGVITGNKDFALSSSAALTLNHPGSFPQISMPMRHLSFNATLKVGAQFFGAFGNVFLGGFYNESRLKDNGKSVYTPAYGYLNTQEINSDWFVMDVNREKEGIVNKETPNLAIPHLTYDIYSVSGQGLSAMYRPFRNDIGLIKDAEVESGSLGLGGGVDMPVKHWGVNLSGNTVRSTSGKWTSNNDLEEILNFRQWQTNEMFEPWFFKSHGEQSVNSIENFAKVGYEGALRVDLSGEKGNVRANPSFSGKDGSIPAANLGNTNSDRNPRNQTIIPYTNEEILNNGKELMALFKVKHFDYMGIYQSNPTTFNYDRSQNPGHHFAGYTAISPEGIRYNYALPVYNRVHEEYQYSVAADPGNPMANTSDSGLNTPEFQHDNTDQYLKATKIPEYVSAYLLTSVVGPDYVDITGDGVSNDDLGYWVKFTYLEKTSSQLYRWRDPIVSAYRYEGGITNFEDDRGSFTYGEKELWYLAHVETKSHIAKFKLEELRSDGMGADERFTDHYNFGESQLGLSEIELFSKGDSGNLNPLKKVRFEYDHSLCKEVPNSTGSNGKLTLKKLWFEYGLNISNDYGVSVGSLTPYEFSYKEQFNYDYKLNAMDRWGVYKPNSNEDLRSNVDYPYVDQNPDNRELIDGYASAWSLTGIKLPSGGEVLVDYEADDYGYVQHKQAMQMAQVVDPNGASNSNLPLTYNLDKNNLKIRFPLKRKIEGNLSVEDQKREVEKYLDLERGQLYFKLMVNLRSQGEDFFDVVEGYAELDRASSMILEKDNSGNYTFGSFYVKGEKGFHPFSLRTWQHIRSNRPDLTAIHKKIPTEEMPETAQKIHYMRGMSSLTPHILQMFKGFNTYCDNRNWGKQLDTNKSFIRLKTPDKTKVGGGIRVRQVTIRDNWTNDEEGIYGHIYEYKKIENGELISSGVASYEPFVGGEENPLRYAKKYSQTILLKSNNSFYFEYPSNESLYPGASVGYSEITVMSLASAFKAGKPVKNIILSNEAPLFPMVANGNFGTTGMKVHEFYTAKDFPVRTYETEKKDIPNQFRKGIPFLGSTEIIHLSSSQGYSIVTNDMHGKPKRISTYRQSPDGKIQKDPISWVKYNYFSKESVYDNERIKEISNTFYKNVDGFLEKSPLEMLQGELFTLGQQVDFVVDMRESQDHIQGTGVNMNVDVVWFAAIPSAWTNLTRKENMLRTAVTNKSIFQSGILESTEAFDEGSIVVTKHLKWDPVTGNPLVSTVTNNFDAPVFSYNIPASHHFESMDGSYRNIGLTYYLTDVRKTEKSPNNYSFKTTELVASNLTRGDEVILYSGELSEKTPIAKVVFLGQINQELVFYSKKNIQSGDLENTVNYYGKIVRSGYRNMLSAEAGKIVALKDPSIKSESMTIPKSIIVPKGYSLQNGGEIH